MPDPYEPTTYSLKRRLVELEDTVTDLQKKLQAISDDLFRGHTITKETTFDSNSFED